MYGGELKEVQTYAQVCASTESAFRSSKEMIVLTWNILDDLAVVGANRRRHFDVYCCCGWISLIIDVLKRNLVNKRQALLQYCSTSNIGV